MKPVVKIFSCVLVCLWLFFLGTQLGTFRAQKSSEKGEKGSSNKIDINVALTPVPGTVPYETPATTEAPSASETETAGSSEAQTTTAAPETTKADNTQESTTDQAQSTTKPADTPNTDKAQIAELFNSAMNSTKNSPRSCNVTKTSTVKIKVTDCSVPSALSAINKIVERFCSDNETEELIFTNGVGKDGETILSELPPMGKNTSLTAQGIQSAVWEDFDGGKKITITLVPETATLEQPPLHHSSSIGYLDAASLDVPATITQADMTYPGATMTLYTNADGLLTKYERVYPMQGQGTAELGFLSGFAAFDGKLEDTWVFAWQ